MLNQEPKNSDFVRYVEALQAGKLAEIKAENRHLEEAGDLSRTGWSQKVSAYLERSAKSAEPAAPKTPGTPRFSRRHVFQFLGFGSMAFAFLLFVAFAMLDMQEGIFIAVWFFFLGIIFLKQAENLLRKEKRAKGGAQQ